MNTVVTRVRVYFNIHRRMFSVQKKTKKGWRLWCHTDFMFLKNVRFIVNENARQRVLRERKKNVHAFIEGEMGSIEEWDEYRWTAGRDNSKEVWYNPYQSSTFLTDAAPDDLDNRPMSISNAKYAVLQLNSQRKPRIYCEL